MAGQPTLAHPIRTDVSTSLPWSRSFDASTWVDETVAGIFEGGYFAGWIRLILDQEQNLRFWTEGSNETTNLAVYSYEGSGVPAVEDLTLVDHVNFGAPYADLARVTLQGGTYYVQFGSYYSSGPGMSELDIHIDYASVGQYTAFEIVQELPATGAPWEFADTAPPGYGWDGDVRVSNPFLAPAPTWGGGSVGDGVMTSGASPETAADNGIDGPRAVLIAGLRADAVPYNNTITEPPFRESFPPSSSLDGIADENFLPYYWFIRLKLTTSPGSGVKGMPAGLMEDPTAVLAVGWLENIPVTWPAYIFTLDSTSAADYTDPDQLFYPWMQELSDTGEALVVIHPIRTGELDLFTQGYLYPGVEILSPTTTPIPLHVAELSFGYGHYVTQGDDPTDPTDPDDPIVTQISGTLGKSNAKFWR